jgi:branched-chain amino acid transport system permease protein
MLVLGYLFATGITTGALYALVALGITIVYRATRAVNFAHGDLFMISGFIAFSLHVGLGFPYVVSLLLTVAAAFAIGIVCERITFRPAIERSFVGALLATMGLAFILKGIARNLWGGKGDYIPFPPLGSPTPFSLGGILVSQQQLFVLGGAVAVMVIFGLFFKLTRLGRMMQATADNRKAAKLVGIRTEHVYMYSFAIGSALAGVAAVLMAPITLLYPDIGFILFVKAFAAAVLGGLTSIPGALLGGVLLGLIETFCAGYVSTNLADVSSYILIMLVLVFIPNGLLGGARARRI